jgi:iron complex outermembrane receptor protein
MIITVRTTPSRLIPALLALTVSALAQTVPPSTDRTTPAEPAIELSPFVINESAETGWVATETLAGSRLRTDFKDVPNQIETLTKEFMSDLGLSTVDQALIYTANVENTTDFNDFTQAQALGDSAVVGGRMRGIGAGTLTRNFFQVYLPTDNYNIDRVTVASGPNAILFGLGSPAGILDSTPARAAMRNKYGFTMLYDSEDSKRITFDANALVIKDRLALRLMGMSQRQYTFKKPNLDRDDRLYGAVTIKPFKNTTLVLQGEKTNRNLNRAARMPPGDYVTPWLNAGQIPGSGSTVAKPVYDNSSLSGIGSNTIFVQAADAPVFSDGASGGARNWRNSVSVRNPRQLPGVDATYDRTAPFTMLDPSIFPFDVNIAGTGRTVVVGGRTTTAMLEQKLASNLFLELAYNHENFYNHRLNAIGTGSGEFVSLNVDPNKYLPNTTTPNPNFGKFYYQGSAQNFLKFRKSSDWRATLSYELNLSQKMASYGRWGKWLGRHRLSGLYTESRSEYRDQDGYRRSILDDGVVIPGVTLRAKTNQNWAIHSTRIPQFRHYFNTPYDATTAPGSMTGDWMMTDANGKPYTLHLFDTGLVASDGKRLGASSTMSGAINKVESLIFAWQGFFLPDQEKRDRLVLTFGVRKDRAQSGTLDAASVRQDFSGLYPVIWDTVFGPYDTSQSGINRSFGVVARPLKWLSVFYNKSTSFDLNVGRFDPFGDEIPGAGGDGKDYGVRLDLWQNRVSLRLNKYENTLGPQNATNQVNDPARARVFNIEARALELDPSLPTINITDGNKRGYRSQGAAGYRISSDRRSTGYEVELNLTPVRNWSIRVNGAKSKAVESNIGEPWFAWVAARLPVWQRVAAKNGEVDASGKPVTWSTAPFSTSDPTGQTLEQYYNNELKNGSFAFISALDGRTTDSARPARANLISNYRVAEGRFKGVNFGGAVRWRGAPTIGYALKPGTNGGMLLDIDRPYMGKRELFFDAILGYRGRMKAFGGFSYRLQLNVRNVLDEQDPIPVTATTKGQVIRIATVEPRLIACTFGVDF